MAKFDLPHRPAPEGMLREVAIIQVGIIGVLCMSDYEPSVLYIRTLPNRTGAMRTSEN